MLEMLSLNLREIVDKIREIARKYEILCQKGDPRCSERNFMNDVEDILKREVWDKLGVKPEYEYRVLIDEGFVGRHYGRIDAYYGLVIFEYKKPYPGLREASVRETAIKQVRDYIRGLPNDENVKAIINKIRSAGFSPLITGVILDGYHVIFVEYNVDTDVFKLDPEVGIHKLDEHMLGRIIRAVMASWRKKLDARLLAADFGYESATAKRAVRALYNALTKALDSGNERVKALFEEWIKLASMVYPINTADLAQLARDYGIAGDGIDGSALFFAIETYYALVLKFIAAEVASRFYDSALMSFIDTLKREIGNEEKLRNKLKEFEEGGPAAWFRISNLLEGQLFSWYLDAWNGDIYKAVKEVVEKLSEYDVVSLTLNPRWARDMFKLLYEELVPREKVRQRLGIYTTPDWLAELILDSLGLTVDNIMKMRSEGKDPLDVRVLDPGVGTGTFLTLYIQRISEYLRKIYGGSIPPKDAEEALRKVVRNVVGFDIEILALMTARANYLIALASAGLLQYKGGGAVEIPIYMANSVVPAELMISKVFVKDGTVEVVKIPTSICDCGEKTKCCFMLPARLVMSGLANDVLNEMFNGLRKDLDYVKLRRALREKFRLDDAEDEVLRELYEKLRELRRRGVDDVWIPVIKSYVLPILYRKSFDYVIGNPPWLSFRYIADPSYQDIVKSIIKDVYALTEEEHLITHMEMAALFLARAVDYYAKDGGRVGFVMPKSIYSADQHHNIRIGATRAHIAFRKIIDCENVQPLFYVPAIAVIAERGKTNWPIEAKVIGGRLPEDRHKVTPLDETKRQLKIEEKKKLFLNSVGSRTFLDYSKFNIPVRRGDYYDDFFQGATIVPQGLWFVRIDDASSPDFVIVETNRARVEERGHVSVGIGLLPVEREFIYGILTSAEVVPFCHLPPNLAVLPITRSSGGYRIITQREAQARGKAHLVKYLKEVEKEWTRSKSSQRMTIYVRLDYDRGLSKQNPGLKYKVVYLRSGTNLAATVVVDEPYLVKVGDNEVKVNGIIIHTTLYLYQTNNEDEAHYLTAVLNSNILNELVKPMQTKGAYGPRDFHKKPLEFPIPRYDSTNPVHRRLSELGKEAREAVCRELDRVLKELGYRNIVDNYYDYMYGSSSGGQVRPLAPNQVGRLRDYIRENVVKDILAEIDRLVIRLLPASSRRGTLLSFMS
jgi:SAM-dependent methyltransferase